MRIYPYLRISATFRPAIWIQINFISPWQITLDDLAAVQQFPIVHCIKPARKGFDMTEQFRTGEQFQRASQEGFDAVVRAYGEANKGLQTIAAEVADYSKKALEDATRAFQQLVTAKSAEQAFEIQSQYAKKAYDAYIAEASKLGEMWVGLARDAYKPVERAVAKTVA
jgi:hypothetical protein